MSGCDSAVENLKTCVGSQVCGVPKQQQSPKMNKSQDSRIGGVAHNRTRVLYVLNTKFDPYHWKNKMNNMTQKRKKMVKGKNWAILRFSIHQNTSWKEIKVEESCKIIAI